MNDSGRQENQPGSMRDGQVHCSCILFTSESDETRCAFISTCIMHHIIKPPSQRNSHSKPSSAALHQQRLSHTPPAFAPARQRNASRSSHRRQPQANETTNPLKRDVTSHDKLCSPPPHTPLLRAHAEKNTGQKRANCSYEMNNSNHILKKKQEQARLHHNYTTTIYTHPPAPACIIIPPRAHSPM